jgi:hypothetical protein
MEVINEGILKALEMLGLGQPQQEGGVLSAVAGMPRPEGKPPIPTSNAMPKTKPPVPTNNDMPKPSPVKDYFDKYVGPEELGSSDMKKYYNKDRGTYKVYQLEGEKRPTVGKGVYLDDQALEQLSLTEIPKEGVEIEAELVDTISYNRWRDALKRATKELEGTKGSVAANALAEMIYQMGSGVVVPGSEKHFPETLRLLKEGKIKEAQEEAKDSNWYGQTKNRAGKVISRFSGAN